MRNILNIVLVIVVIGVIIFLVKSSNSTKVEEVNTGNGEPTTQLPDNSIKGCYVSTLAKDIYSLNIETQVGDKITGTLSYNNFEKDSSMGTFEGVYTNNILLVNYTFNSEGMHSVVQSIFKKVGDDFIQGFGDFEEKDGAQYFKDISKIEFEPDGLVFVPSDKCPDVNSDIIKTIIYQFGSQLKMVSLLASDSEIKAAMNNNYSQFVAPELLKKWQADPVNAPGKTVSSPWPDHIKINSVDEINPGTYQVKGTVIEMTSAEPPNDISSQYDVFIELEKINGNWMIIDYKKA